MHVLEIVSRLKSVTTSTSKFVELPKIDVCSEQNPIEYPFVRRGGGGVGVGSNRTKQHLRKTKNHEIREGHPPPSQTSYKLHLNIQMRTKLKKCNANDIYV